MNSISYYDKNADQYFEDTLNLDMSSLYEYFELTLSEKDHILDLGCGSGRDSNYFFNKGYKITSVDGSLEMVKLCREFLSTKVIHSTFEDYETDETFQGIWACASLLHVDRKNLFDIIEKYISLLKINGSFFMSFKVYEEDFEFDNRSFTCFTKSSLKEFVSPLNHVEVVYIVETDSVQKSNMKWVSVILKKLD